MLKGSERRKRPRTSTSPRTPLFVAQRYRKSASNAANITPPLRPLCFRRVWEARQGWRLRVLVLGVESFGRSNSVKSRESTFSSTFSCSISVGQAAGRSLFACNEVILQGFRLRATTPPVCQIVSTLCLSSSTSSLLDRHFGKARSMVFQLRSVRIRLRPAASACNCLTIGRPQLCFQRLQSLLQMIRRAGVSVPNPRRRACRLWPSQPAEKDDPAVAHLEIRAC